MSNEDNRTDRRKAEEAFRESESKRMLGFAAQLQVTLNVIPAFAWYAAPSGEFTFVNKRTADYLGLPNDHPLRFGIDIGARWDAHIPCCIPTTAKNHAKLGQPVCARARPLKLKLASKKVDGNRVYQIKRGGGTRSGLRPSERRSS